MAAGGMSDPAAGDHGTPKGSIRAREGGPMTDREVFIKALREVLEEMIDNGEIVRLDGSRLVRKDPGE